MSLNVEQPISLIGYFYLQDAMLAWYMLWFCAYQSATSCSSIEMTEQIKLVPSAYLALCYK